MGSVVPTKTAILPAAVGLDIGGGMMAPQTNLNAHDLEDILRAIRTAIEAFMVALGDLMDGLHAPRQVVCVKA